MTLREKAMKWWNDLDISKKEELFLSYRNFTPATNWQGLTGREIQNIWAVQTTA